MYSKPISIKLRFSGLLGPDYEQFGRILPKVHSNPLQLSCYPYAPPDIHILSSIVHCNEDEGKPAGK